MKLNKFKTPLLLILASFVCSPAGYTQTPESQTSQLSEEVTKLSGSAVMIF
ncbi:hypothetical protein [Dolichospermum compactum]|uniref:Uncharacterized protein n=1 Tax=Dolichospermum compactum NIES-806 TaxID=1973481 RepID=A0A1Z4V613_9CYAN|nr:hypothetical protein [Dolichospermum compactum]BAZ86972.1 hypothetical protein NIES806_31900 [Dolichospermum compactum NIES-806]